MVVYSSAAGQYVAPMIIFKRKRMMIELGTGAPPGCLVEISDSGYINSDLFVKWLQQFINAVKPTKENKVLLVLVTPLIQKILLLWKWLVITASLCCNYLVILHTGFSHSMLLSSNP